MKTEAANPYSKPQKIGKNLAKSERRLSNINVSTSDFTRRDEFKKLDRKVLAPGAFQAFYQATSAMVTPASLFTFFLVCLFGAYRSVLMIEEEVTAPSEAEKNIASMQLDRELAATLDQSAPVDVKSADQEKKRQLTYITGLISMHLPETREGGKIARHIVNVAEEMVVDPFYITAIISSESRFIKNARSRVGAVGLMQLMKPTAREVYKQISGKDTDPDRTDPLVNIKMGTTYIRQMERHYNGNRFNALAAYNWGPGNLDKALKSGKRLPKGVRKYANGILEKTLRWRKHFQSAEKQVQEL